MYTASVVLIIAVILGLQLNVGDCLLRDGKLTVQNTVQKSHEKLQDQRNSSKANVQNIKFGNFGGNGTIQFELNRKQQSKGQVEPRNNNDEVFRRFQPKHELWQRKHDNSTKDLEKRTQKHNETISQKSHNISKYGNKNFKVQRKFQLYDSDNINTSINARPIKYGESANRQKAYNRHVIENYDHHPHHRHHSHHHHQHHHHQHHHHHYHHHQHHHYRQNKEQNTKLFARSSALVHKPRNSSIKRPHNSLGYRAIRISSNRNYVNKSSQGRLKVKTTEEATPEKRFVVVGGNHRHHHKRFHFTPELVNAMKLVLNKKNSFKKDADILNLAIALQSKDSSESSLRKNNSITTSISSGLTRNGHRVRLVTVKDPGYIKAKVHQQQLTKVKVRQQEELLKQAVYHTKTTKDTKSGLLQQRVPTASHYKNRRVHNDSFRPASYDKNSVYTKHKVLLQEEPNKDLGNTKGGLLSQDQLLRQAAFRSRSKISEDLNGHPNNALVNPTALGISILKLLFGKRAKLVVKPNYRLLVGGRPGIKYLEGYGTPEQRAELQKEIEQENRLMLLKGLHKEKFETMLAKSVSKLIHAISKKEEKTTEEDAVSHHKNQLKESSIVDQNGNRKSWVLLKMPKNGEKEDESVQKYEDNEGEKSSHSAIKQATTVGKHNNMMSDVKVISHQKPETIKSYDDDDTAEPAKIPKEISTDTPSRTVPEISYNLSGIKSKNELQRKTSSTDSLALSSTLGKILKGIQESIKELKEQQKKPESPIKGGERVTSLGPLASLTSSDTSPVSLTSSGASQAAAVAKIPDLMMAVNKLLGSGSHSNTPSLHGMPSDQTGVESSTISVPTVDSQADAARRFVNNVREANNPLMSRPALGMYDEPITTSSHSKNSAGQEPGDNVLFESDELATQRDTQASIDAIKLKEDLEAFAEGGLKKHNFYRELHHAPQLKWSDDLATQAEKLAYDMAVKGAIEKSNVATTLGYGENVAKISGTTFNKAGEEATNLWYAEVTNYSFSDPRLSPKTDSFTQVVWKSTSKLGMGCARDLQTNDLYVVALYDHKGNDPVGLRSNVLNKGEVTEDVYASIFKRHKLHSNGQTIS